MSYNELTQVKNVLSTERYAFYLRKSRADLELEALGEGETLAKHMKILEGLAAKYDVHPDQVTVYKEVVSGESLLDRPQATQLLEHVLQGQYAAVFVVEIERLARGNTRDQGEVAEAFQASGTKIITPLKVYDPDNEYDEEYFEFGLFMSRREFKTHRRRMKSGKDLAAKDGNYLLPQRVFGYKIIRPSKKVRTLEPIPEEVKLVQMIFDWYTEEGRSTSWIAKQLTMMGIPTAKKKPQWHRNTVLTMLTNPIYIGKLTWNGSKTTKEYDPASGRLKKVRKFDLEPEVYEGKQPGIISVEQFEKAQWISKKTKQPSTPTEVELVNPFAGLMVCRDCGRHVIARSYKDGRGMWVLHARETVCKKKQMPLDQVVEAFVAAVQASIEDAEIQSQRPDNQELERYQATLSAMRADLAKKEQQRKNLFQDYEDGVYTRDEFIERKQHYNQVIEEVRANIEKLKAAAPEPVDYDARIYTLRSLIACVNDPDLSAQDKNDFLKQFISKITYDAVDFGHKKGGKPVLEVFFH